MRKDFLSQIYCRMQSRDREKLLTVIGWNNWDIAAVPFNDLEPKDLKQEEIIIGIAFLNSIIDPDLLVESVFSDKFYRIFLSCIKYKYMQKNVIMGSLYRAQISFDEILLYQRYKDKNSFRNWCHKKKEVDNFQYYSLLVSFSHHTEKMSIRHYKKEICTALNMKRSF